MDKKNESRLSIATSPDGSESSVQIYGTNAQNLFNLALLFRAVCAALDTTPDVMGLLLPGIIRGFEKDGMAASATAVNVGAIRRAKEGGTP